MIETHVDTSALDAAIAEFAKDSRKDMGDVYKQQAGVMVGRLIAVTPPGGKGGQAIGERGGITMEAKKRGESRIAADIAKLFPTTRAKEETVLGWIRAGHRAKVGNNRSAVVRDIAFSEARIAHIHQLARNKATGRTSAAGGNMMAYARAAQLKAYIRKEQRKVGKLAAGFIRAAQALKTASRSVPAWITRHGAGPGGASVRDSGPKTSVRVWNDNQWFPSGMGARAALALRQTHKALLKTMAVQLEKRAVKANQRQR